MKKSINNKRESQEAKNSTWAMFSNSAQGISTDNEPGRRGWTWQTFFKGWQDDRSEVASR